MRIIDSHIHFWAGHPITVAEVKKLDIHLLNICVPTTPNGGWRNQAKLYHELIQKNSEHFSWATAFDLPRFDDPNFVKSCIEQLDRDFANGAVAVKVWKNLGMEVKKPDGSWFLVDDPLLTPIIAHIAKRGKALISHIAEPITCWQSLDGYDDRHHHAIYYRENPQWHMYGKPGVMSYETLIASRDNLLKRHPDLMHVGAHIGSMEHDLKEVGKRFDQFPKFHVDTAARLGDLLRHDQQEVRDFCIKYQDRILMGSDCAHCFPYNKPMEDAQADEAKNALALHVIPYRTYFATDQVVKYHGAERRGLNLPPAVAEKILRLNAKRCFKID
jgi:predicted TIM-barrel fold metal-dependent hydrolase